MKAANAAAFKLAKELGFEKFRSQSHNSIAGGIVSLYAETKPDGYAYTYGSNEKNDFFPKKCKANKEILYKIANLPVVDSDKFTNPIKWDWRALTEPTGERHGQSRILFSPGLSFPKSGEVLIHVPDWITKYKPVIGMTEITFTEYQKLNK